MRILSLTGGAGNMYCGSCLRDNALAAEFLRRGHQVVLSPVYTPTKTDEANVSDERIFQNLDGDSASKAGVMSFVDFTHPTFTNEIYDLVMLDALARRESLCDAEIVSRMRDRGCFHEAARDFV